MSAAHTLMLVALPASLAMKGIVRAGAFITLVARGRKPTATARPWNSAMLAVASGRLALVTRATAVTKRGLVLPKALQKLSH